jgi:hypothetical protein
VEPYKPGFDVWSLVQLLEDMRRAAEAFGRSEIEGLFDSSDAPSYEGELRDFLVESMWKNVGDVDGGADRLRARQIKEDIKGLRDATEDVKRYADLVVARRYASSSRSASESMLALLSRDVPRFSICNNELMTSAVLFLAAFRLVAADRQSALNKDGHALVKYALLVSASLSTRRRRPIKWTPFADRRRAARLRGSNP